MELCLISNSIEIFRTISMYKFPLSIIFEAVILSGLLGFFYVLYPSCPNIAGSTSYIIVFWSTT